MPHRRLLDSFHLPSVSLDDVMLGGVHLYSGLEVAKCCVTRPLTSDSESRVKGLSYSEIATRIFHLGCLFDLSDFDLRITFLLLDPRCAGCDVSLMLGSSQLYMT